MSIKEEKEKMYFLALKSHCPPSTQVGLTPGKLKPKCIHTYVTSESLRVVFQVLDIKRTIMVSQAHSLSLSNQSLTLSTASLV